MDLVLHEIQAVSCLQTEEYFWLVSTFWAIVDQNYNCTACKKAYAQDYRDSRKSCSVLKSSEVAAYREIKYFICPGNFYNGGYALIVDMFRQFQRGILPFTGGFLDQPSKLVDTFNLLENLHLEHQRDIDKKAKQWQTVKSKSNSPSRNSKR